MEEWFTTGSVYAHLYFLFLLVLFSIKPRAFFISVVFLYLFFWVGFNNV